MIILFFQPFYLHAEEDENPILVNEICHEGHFGNGNPSRPGEEVVDDAAKSSAAGEDKPR